MPINSRKKGAKNERKITALYKTWTGYDFARTPASGGLRWKHNQNIVGDLVCTDERHSPKFPFTVEAKSYREINFEHLISTNAKIKILEFWDQATTDASRANKIPILMMRYNGMENDLHYLCLPWKFFDTIKTEITFNYGYLKYMGLEEAFVILSSKDFFATDYDTIRILGRNYIKLQSNGKG